jgi:hypothetical protein
MIGIAEDRIDDLVQRFATSVTMLTDKERDVHATQIVNRLKNAVLAGDEQAQKIWPLMLQDRSGPEIDTVFGFKAGTTDTVKKRIWRRARTFLRGLLYGQGE